MGAYEWVDWMLKRPDRKARQRRFFNALDSAMPNWEGAIKSSDFKMWACWTHPVTRKSRLAILETLSLEKFDGINTARLLEVSLKEQSFLKRFGTLYIEPNEFFSHGSIIDKRYEVMGHLGSGGFGDVTKVYSHEVEEFFALKTLKSRLLADVNARAQFILEADLWVKIGQHKHIVRAEFIDKIGDEHVILMELIEASVDGQVSLQEYISSSAKLSIEKSVNFSVGICEGMSHAYLMGVRAHRDLKPDNILIENGITAKVTDFGISSLARSSLFTSNLAGKIVQINSTTGDAIMGTLPYMAPEQFLNSNSCDERSDIYSFGVILYQLISKGQWPYGDISAVMKKVANADVPLRFYQLHSQERPKFLLHRLFKIAKACLQKDPESRPKSFQDVRLMLVEASNIRIDVQETDNGSDVFDPWETGRTAVSFLRLGRYEEALELFDEILEKYPLGVQWEFDKALTLSKLGRDQEAADLYSKILDRDPKDLRALLNKGLLCKKSGDLEQAVRLYSTALEYHPDDSSSLVNLGNIAYEREDYKTAGRYYKRILEVDSEDVNGWYNLGLAYRALGLSGQSSQCFKKFLHFADPLDSRRENTLLILQQFG